MNSRALRQTSRKPTTSMHNLREELLALYRAAPEAEEYFTFPVFFAVLCEKHGLEREGSAPSAETRAGLLADARLLLSGYPWQYLLGECDFYSRVFACREEVLIPREETELLVREAIRLLPEDGVFYDFCTGSGCIAVSVLCEKPGAVGVAVDVSEAALSLARENAARHGVLDRLLTRRRDLLTEPGGAKAFDLLLMNPPYIRTDVVDTLSKNVSREPRLALDGGADGLVFYRRVLSRLSSYVKEGGSALFEIGFDQGADILRLAKAYGYEGELLQDAEKRDRILKITLAKCRNI